MDIKIFIIKNDWNKEFYVTYNNWIFLSNQGILYNLFRFLFANKNISKNIIIFHFCYFCSAFVYEHWVFYCNNLLFRSFMNNVGNCMQYIKFAVICSIELAVFPSNLSQFFIIAPRHYYLGEKLFKMCFSRLLSIGRFGILT